MLDYIAAHNTLFLTIIFFLSLAIGSFINVVIYRLPIMLEREWKQQCLEYLEQTPELKNEAERYNLAHPASHCPSCNTQIKAWHNIPVLSFFLLKGKCSSCKSKIPLRYLTVETLTCALSIVIAWQFGLSWTLIAALIFTWYLVVITFIDIDHLILPDSLSFTLLWMGLLFSCFNLFTDTQDAILGAIIGYSSFWIIAKLFYLVSKKEGMGYGDFKLLAAVGAWLGWQLLPLVILTSSILSVIIGSCVLIYKRKSRNTPIPFGPFIAIAAWIALIWGFDITQHYLHLFGIDWSNV